MYKNLFFLLVLIGCVVISCKDTGTNANKGNTERETPTYTISVAVNPSNSGSISPSVNGPYNKGDEVDLQANSEDGYLFINWTGDIESSENPLSITIDKDYSLTANFEIKTYELAITTKGKGTVNEEIIQQKSKDYEHGTVVELTANPAEGYEFVEWQGDLSSTENPQQITIDDPKSVTAIFEKKSFTLSIVSSGDGTVSKNPDQSEYQFGSTVDLTAKPANGWKFIKWEEDLSGSENPVQFTLREDALIKAVFHKKLEGIITTNTTLSPQDGPYQITDKVQIAYGAKLTIEPGVMVYAEEQANNESNLIEVFGQLSIKGTENSNVILENVKINPGDNSPSELYKIDIHYVDMIGGELYSPTGRSIYGSINLTDSFLYRVNRSEFIKTYMYIWYPQANSYIERNIFYNSGRISSGHRDANVYIKNNLFVQNNMLSNEIGYAIENWASYDTSRTVLENNTFYNTGGVAVSLPSGYDSASLSAINNYWNTTNTDIIEDMIYDKGDDLSTADAIAYDPFLTSPHFLTPLIPDSLK